MITKSEIISAAFSRNIDTAHIKDADIDIAVRKYVNAYVSDYSGKTSFINTFIKPVIAFGVACDIFHRLAAEITDRGVVAMVSDGATILNTDSKMATLKEFEEQRDQLIDIMMENAEAAGVTVVDMDEYCSVGFTGQARGAKL